MTTIVFFAPGIPKGQPRPRAFYNKKIGQARVYDAGTAEGWKSAVAAAALPYRPETPLAGPLQVDITFFMPRPKGHYRTGKHAGELKADSPVHHVAKPDRDNLDKAVLDALTAIGFWRDDAQVCRGEVIKSYADRHGAKITITSLEAKENRNAE